MSLIEFAIDLCPWTLRYNINRLVTGRHNTAKAYPDSGPFGSVQHFKLYASLIWLKGIRQNTRDDVYTLPVTRPITPSRASTSRTSALPCAQPSRLHSCAVGGACAADERARRCGAEGLGELADCAWCWRWWRECTRLYRAGEAGRFQLVVGLSWTCSARLRDVTNLRL